MFLTYLTLPPHQVFRYFTYMYLYIYLPHLLHLHVPIHITTIKLLAYLTHSSSHNGAERSGRMTSTASFYPEHPERYSPDSDIIMSGMLDSSLIVHARRTEYHLPT